MEVTVFNELDPIFQYNSFSANQKAIGNNFELSKLLKKMIRNLFFANRLVLF